MLDCSIVLAWAFADESSAEADRAMTLAADRGLVVPAIWWYEIRNALVMGERRGRIEAESSRAVLAALAELSPVCDFNHHEATIMDLARSLGLSLYDAAYMEVAGRLGLPLATLDKGLRRAAGKAAVELV
ncbi:MAG: type II toxin-antitoxin system VapC family toxin [Planctomycetia bacterium]